MKKRIKAAAGIIMLSILTACGRTEAQPNPNLEHEGVITQQAATDSTFAHIEEQEEAKQKTESSDEKGSTTELNQEISNQDQNSAAEMSDGENKPSEENKSDSEAAEETGSDTEQPTEEVDSPQTFCYVTADILNIRSQPSVQAELVTHAAYGEAVAVTGKEEDGFLQIQLPDGRLAYASKDYLTETEPAGDQNDRYSFAAMPVVDTSKALYSYEEMKTDLKELAARFPDRVQLETAGQTADGRELYVVTLGNPQAERYVVVHASIHAREYLTTLLVMKQLEYYATYYDTKAYAGIPFSKLFDTVAVVIVPMANPDGVSISQFGTDGLQTEACRETVERFYEQEGAGRTKEAFFARFKANARGVDLNRNFSYGWDEFTGSSVPASERYKGTEAGSEAETKVLMELTGEGQMAGISYHATGSVLYWDFGQSGELRERCLEVTNLVHNLTGYTIQYASNNKQDEAGYCEWLVGVMGVPEVTIEIGTQAAPLKIAEFASIWGKNKDVPAAVAALYMEP